MYLTLFIQATFQTCETFAFKILQVIYKKKNQVLTKIKIFLFLNMESGKVDFSLPRKKKKGEKKKKESYRTFFFSFKYFLQVFIHMCTMCTYNLCASTQLLYECSFIKLFSLYNLALSLTSHECIHVPVSHMETKKYIQLNSCLIKQRNGHTCTVQTLWESEIFRYQFASTNMLWQPMQMIY